LPLLALLCSTVKIHIPNIITFARMALSPVFVWFLLESTTLSALIAFVLFVVGAITDYMDGYYARKFGVVSNFGNFMDPLADKVLTTAAFVGFAWQNRVEWWMVWVVIVRDGLMTLMRLYGDRVKMPVKTSWSAKVKTTVQMVYIIVVLLIECAEAWIHRLPLPQTVSVFDAIIEWLVYTVQTLHVVYIGMVVVATITAWTAIEYMYENRALLRRLARSIIQY
jgi:CDP-diacylglycerol---glycerol-3-phosphate 3-phosphatidyltransferase